MRINTDLAAVLLEALRAAGYQAGVCGGYARDTFFGVEPKDMDIVVCVGELADDDAVSIANSKVETILFNACYEHKLYVSRQCFGMYNDHASDRACGVIKYPDDGIDVILYRDCDTMEDVIDAFDFNLNQFGLLDNGECAYYGESDLRELKAVRGDASLDRGIRVLGKHRALLPAIEQAYSEGRLV